MPLIHISVVTSDEIHRRFLLSWQRIEKTYGERGKLYAVYGKDMTSYDLMVVAVPNDLNFTDVEFHTQSVTLIE